MTSTTTANTTASPLVIHKGGCHCGRVRYEVDAPAELEITDCNCSICHKKGFLHLIVPRTRFRLLQGADDVALYMFGTGAAKHYFCRHCGVCSYYIPRSNPDGVDVNFRCLDPGTVQRYTTTPFDGQNWEEQPSLAHLSQE
ncbi:glutathione-dependent formaldehyde-activating [Thamnocephalis sphaerospora]|uniref:Glutathione-dependent formaldehyde-activating n=1 Tax=Thamnocephalis sphaerospora TaxID=78915 RepID=A0A4P9XIF0_9FUNG|nr:glutathione-dependent formaldehyde-activating [Thamnocephalis sphaerospora]|eukprot:RKP05131.1 glutathione-dependent formaldehyde-activating [Thamnocephalis sphaerospora]